MNYSELRAEMVRCGVKVSDMASALGLSRSALYRKMSGNTEFLQSEISAISKLLRLNDSQIISIFFTQKVS